LLDLRLVGSVGSCRGSDGRQAHFTASEKVSHGLETVATALRASIRNSCADNGYGMFGMDKGTSVAR